MNKLKFELKEVDGFTFPIILKEDGETIATAPIRDGLYSSQIPEYERLVLCFNAFDGIENPEKFIKDVKEYKSEMENSSLSAQIIENQKLKDEISYLNEQLEILKDSYNKTLDEKPFNEKSLEKVLNKFFTKKPLARWDLPPRM